MAKVDWNPGAYEASKGFEVMPKGRYLTMPVNIERKETKGKTGQYDEIEFVVLKPDAFKNRKLWARLNVYNDSETAQRIGREQFNGLCVASGIDPAKIKDTDSLLNKPQVSIVSIVDGTKGPTNKIDGWLKASDNDRKSAGDIAKTLKKEAPKEQSSSKGSAGKNKPSAEPSIDDDDIPF